MNQDSASFSDPKILDDLAHRLAGSLPRGLQLMQADVERHLRAALEAAFKRLDLVTREELDIQAAVLARTRTKVDALESRVRELERRLAVSKPGRDSD
jgi:BMFP domain-containing protein YqiC